MKEHRAKLERMYVAAPVNRPLGVSINISEGRCEIEMPVREPLFHAAGAVHGSYYFKMLDDAAFFACNSLIDDVFVLTASFNTQLFRPVDEGVLRSVGEVTKPGRNLYFASAKLFDQSGNELGRGEGVFARTSIRLAGTPGYV